MTNNQALSLAYVAVLLFGLGLTAYARIMWGKPIRLFRSRRRRHA